MKRIGLIFAGIVLACCLVLSIDAAPVLNILITPHSHDDVGWLQTVDAYYENQVRSIYQTVTQSLAANPNRKFNPVEIAFFSKWWLEDATANEQNLWLEFVENGQVEFLSGGWVMNDDAGASYDSIIHQYTLGQAFLHNVFGIRPKIGWMIDPFGLSSQTASIFAQMGFNAEIFRRVRADIEAEWQYSQQLEFIWQASPNNLGDRANIFCKALDIQGYDTQKGYYFEDGDGPVNKWNIDMLASGIVNNAKTRAKFLRQETNNNFMWLYGTDFKFVLAQENYDNMDQLINYINQNENKFQATARYATVSEYFQLLNSANVTWRGYQGDFFPYHTNSTYWRSQGWSDQGNGYWTGYYTSRGQLKGLIRQTENVMRSTEIQYVTSTLAGRDSSTIKQDYQAIMQLRQAVAENQHHDAVTGTSEAPVVASYINDLVQATQVVTPINIKSTQQLLSTPNNNNNNRDLFSLTTSASTLTRLLQTGSVGTCVSTVLYNNLAWNLVRYVSVSVPRKDLSVVDMKGKPVNSQVNPTMTSGTFTLYFSANLPALGYNTYFICIQSDRSKQAPFGNYTQKAVREGGAPFFIENDVYQLSFDGESGLLTQVHTKQDGTSLSVNQRLMSYKSWTRTGNGLQTSGAYVFHSTGRPVPIEATSSSVIATITGPYVQEVIQAINSTYTQTIRIYTTNSNSDPIAHAIEIVNDLGPLPGNNEIVAVFDTDVDSGDLFYTDANGLEVRQRQRASDINDVIAGNYYPMVSYAFIRDAVRQLTIVSDRSHGASSQYPGELEVMLHRRPTQSDGLGPKCDDTDRLTDVKLWTIVDTPQVANRLRHTLSLMLQNPPSTLFGFYTNQTSNNNASTFIQEWSTGFNSYAFSPSLKSPFPANLHLLTMKIPDTSVWPFISSDLYYYNRNNNKGISSIQANATIALVRLLHTYEKGEDASYSSPITYDLQNLFPSNKIVSIEERCITGLCTPKEVQQQRWKWFVTGNNKNYDNDNNYKKNSLQTPTQVILQPMEIATFLVTF